MCSFLDKSCGSEGAALWLAGSESWVLPQSRRVMSAPGNSTDQEWGLGGIPRREGNGCKTGKNLECPLTGYLFIRYLLMPLGTSVSSLIVLTAQASCDVKALWQGGDYSFHWSFIINHHGSSSFLKPSPTSWSPNSSFSDLGHLTFHVIHLMTNYQVYLKQKMYLDPCQAQQKILQWLSLHIGNSPCGQRQILHCFLITLCVSLISKTNYQLLMVKAMPHRFLILRVPVMGPWKLEALPHMPQPSS